MCTDQEDMMPLERYEKGIAIDKDHDAEVVCNGNCGSSTWSDKYRQK